MMILKFLYSFYDIYAKIFRPLCVGARVILEKDNKYIFVMHTYKDYYYPPGGGVKWNESLEDCVKREAYEEVGAKIKNLKLVSVISDFSEKRDYVAIFYSNDFDLTPVKSREIAEIVHVDKNNLLSDIQPVLLEELKRMCRIGII